MITEQAEQQTESTSRANSVESPLTRRALNLPNLITLIRLLLAFVLFTMIEYSSYWVAAACLFVFAAATDALDGWIARRYQMITTLGRILDPFVDKIIVCGAFIFLLARPESGVNAWMVVILIGREMFVSTLRGFLEQHGKDFAANWAGKIKMILQSVAVTASLLSMDAQLSQLLWFNPTRDILLWGAVIATAYSGLIYIFRATSLLISPVK